MSPSDQVFYEVVLPSSISPSATGKSLPLILNPLAGPSLFIRGDDDRWRGACLMGEVGDDVCSVYVVLKVFVRVEETLIPTNTSSDSSPCWLSS